METIFDIERYIDLAILTTMKSAGCRHVFIPLFRLCNYMVVTTVFLSPFTNIISIRRTQRDVYKYKQWNNVLVVYTGNEYKVLLTFFKYALWLWKGLFLELKIKYIKSTKRSLHKNGINIRCGNFLLQYQQSETTTNFVKKLKSTSSYI